MCYNLFFSLYVFNSTICFLQLYLIIFNVIICYKTCICICSADVSTTMAISPADQITDLIDGGMHVSSLSTDLEDSLIEGVILYII